jgi:phosphoribosylpyrophosphate synthetase
MSTEYQVLRYITDHLEASIVEMERELSVSKQMIHRVLLTLQNEGRVKKVGRVPKVYYKLVEKKQEASRTELDHEQEEFLKEHFNLFTMNGELLEGVVAFQVWCDKQKLPLLKTLAEYTSTLEKYKSNKQTNDLIDGTQKIINTKGLERVCLEEVVYGDFYAIERFGKTRLGNLVHFAKQGQNREMIGQICRIIEGPLFRYIKDQKIEAVAFIPPTIKRSIQFMAVLEQKLNIKLPIIKLDKVSGRVPIPQKALSKIADRVKNAQESIIVADREQYGRVLLIDDAIGSGATINETASKLLYKKTATEVYGYAVVGSYKGFEVIQEI